MKLTALKRFVLILAALAVGMSAARAEKVSRLDLESVEKAVEAQSLEHKKLQDQAIQINIELNEISQEMIKAAKLIQNNEEKLSKMELQLDKLKEELQVAEDGFAIQDDNLIRTLAALQNLALKPTEALFVQPLTPVEIIRSAMLLRETVPYLEENANKIRLELEKIETKKNLVEQQFTQISQQKKILEREHEKMKILVQKKSKIRNAVEIKSAQTQKKVDLLASQANDIRDLLGKLEAAKQEKKRKEDAKRQRLLAEQAEKDRQNALQKQEETQTADLNKFQSDSINATGDNFIRAKGRIPMPARGPIVTYYGEQKVKGVSSKGIIIRTRNAAQVTAPFDGSVIFAGPFRGYGNLIIIEHGQGYLTLLAGLDSIDVELGQMLLAGEPVGQMPADGDAKLYTELRKNNQPIDPLSWMTEQ